MAVFAVTYKRNDEVTNDELGKDTSRNEALIFQYMCSIHQLLMSVCFLKMVKRVYFTEENALQHIQAASNTT
jgi:hypothetical protein